MTYDLGPSCLKPDCSRPIYLNGLCAQCYRASTATDRQEAIELCKDAAAMQRTLQEIRNLEEAA